MPKPIPRSFFERDPQTVAQKLLGNYVVRVLPTNEILIGIISETEAYLGESDPAAHASHGKTKRTQILYDKAGLAYMHAIHRQACLDVTCEGINKPGCVLIRSIIPFQGVDQMKKNRGRSTDSLKGLTDGPGKLTQALNIDMSFYGHDLTNPNSPLYIAYGDMVNVSFLKTPRIGISKAKQDLLRFLLQS